LPSKDIKYANETSGRSNEPSIYQPSLLRAGPWTKALGSFPSLFPTVLPREHANYTSQKDSKESQLFAFGVWIYVEGKDSKIGRF
jgi:hypothetical protein